MRRQAHICLHGLLCLGLVCFLLFFHSRCLSVSLHAPAAVRMFSEAAQEDEWYQWISLEVYSRGIFKQTVYEFGYHWVPGSDQRQSKAASVSVVVLGPCALYFSQHLFSFSVFLPLFGSVQNLTSSSITWPQNTPHVLLAYEWWSFTVIFGECQSHKRITKLQKCCTHGTSLVLF